MDIYLYHDKHGRKSKKIKSEKNLFYNYNKNNKRMIKYKIEPSMVIFFSFKKLAEKIQQPEN